jgi:hypothetical protein
LFFLGSWRKLRPARRASFEELMERAIERAFAELGREMGA